MAGKNDNVQLSGSKRDAMLSRLQAKYPDKEFADDESMYDQIGSDYDDYDEQLQGYKDREQGFADMFTNDPRSARMMMAWKDGEDPAISLIRLYGDDIRAILDDPDRQEEIAAANKEYMSRVAKEKEYEDQYKTNLQQSIQTLEQLKEEKGLSDEDMDKAMEWLTQVTTDAVLGKFDPATLEMALKAQGYDDAVASASEEGEVRGRNAKITEKLRGSNKGDGAGALSSRTANGSYESPSSDMGVLDNFGGDDIYTRGGYKRTRRS